MQAEHHTIETPEGVDFEVWTHEVSPGRKVDFCLVDNGLHYREHSKKTLMGPVEYKWVIIPYSDIIAWQEKQLSLLI